MLTKTDFIYALELAALRDAGAISVQVAGHTVAFFLYGETVYAVDNRCPHMGFPLDRGTVHDGLLTCHWHHARFDLASGGTFDQFADDVPTYPVEVRDGQIWVQIDHAGHDETHYKDRLAVGLERDIPLVIGKAVTYLMERGDSETPFTVGLDFGTTYRDAGWGQGLTIHACMMNLVPYCEPTDQRRALYHGLSAVAGNTSGQAPRFRVRPLPNDIADVATLTRWFRQFIEVRDDEGAERCVISAVRAGAQPHELAAMLFAAATDHRYINVGHPLDFTNKALEALDRVGWDAERTEIVLSSLVRNYAVASRMEESNEWRHPVDLIVLLEDAFAQLEEALASGEGRSWSGGRTHIVDVMLQDDPQATIEALLNALRSGASIGELASAVSYAAALRIAQFHTSNEFGDWDTALHTFTFANAVEMGLRRAPTVELLRGVFDAAMSIYLDRFLNIPAAKLPNSTTRTNNPAALLEELPHLLDRQQQVNQAGQLAAQYLYSKGEPDELLAVLAGMLLREDRDFHTIQCVEAAFNQYQLNREKPEAVNFLVAAARYVAAHAPTVRAQEQTFTIVQRLHRGERLFEGS